MLGCSVMNAPYGDNKQITSRYGGEAHAKTTAALEYTFSMPLNLKLLARCANDARTTLASTK
jgi:hypothetical protein